MRAAEVELEAIGAGVFGPFHEFMPALARIDHQRSDDSVIGPAFLHFGNFAEIGLDGAIADQLDIVEANHAHGPDVHGRITRRNVDDRIADGFPDHPAPAGFERTMRLIGSVRRRAGSDPKRVGGFDAGEID